MSAIIGGWLQSKGLQKGDRVAVMMPNILQYSVVLPGILRAGYTVVNVNPLYTPRELEHQLKDSGAKAIFVLENFASTFQAVRSKVDVEHVVVTSMGDMLGGLKGAIVNLVVRKVKKMVPAWSLPGHVTFKSVVGSNASLSPVDIGLDDIAFLQYTGGTTGLSKGAVLLNRNVLSNAAQNDEWLKAIKDMPQNPLYICALPLYHIFALTVNMIMGMRLGSHNILIPNPRDIPGFVKELKNYKFDVFPGLNTLFNALMNHDDFKNLDFSALRLTLGGGMAVQQPVAERWQQITGCNISEGYGLSETAPVATANRFDADKFSGTIGLPLPSTDIAIRDEDGKDVPLGDVGEICIRGPQVMAGYWQRKDATDEVMTKDNFFKSGDMGFMNEAGQTKIVDRKKDMILVSGFNVYPNEIEEVAVSHEHIVEAAAVSMPHEHSGEVVKLFIVSSDPNMTEQDVKDWCAKGLTNYKRPHTVVFKDDLPKTNVGKILRRELRDS
jgi:long-chain acyl-CoA synthetase